ncbi:hypothetical protein K3G63_22050 [Hymenobacter sp. HSC-4F20]|uniref:hypothetical protein n=1 Tax=Hymenobacter sp. HSC-4F20 TaxID=2864135 RepID=UPI001C72D067|nr:hypothetical protein [Hymenobacter sp. HSC-4F20]MBX0293144.1 hypothetical protein [Hymenobacter sp. HSC-4F20]
MKASRKITAATVVAPVATASVSATKAKAVKADAPAKSKRAPRAKRAKRPQAPLQYHVVTPEGKKVSLSSVRPGDQLAVYTVTNSSTAVPVQVTPAPIIGWARTSTGISLYLPGSTNSSFRSALEEEEGTLVEECFFTPATPTTLCEVAIQEHSVGELVYYPAVNQTRYVTTSTIRP